MNGLMLAAQKAVGASGKFGCAGAATGDSDQGGSLFVTRIERWRCGGRATGIVPTPCERDGPTSRREIDRDLADGGGEKAQEMSARGCQEAARGKGVGGAAKLGAIHAWVNKDDNHARMKKRAECY